MKRFNQIIIVGLLLFTLAPVVGEKVEFVPKRFKETFRFQILWKGFEVGNVLMNTVPTKDDYLKINASVSSFDLMKKIYYVGGRFGAMWNYKTQRPYLAYEDVHQGDKYFRRKFKFKGNEVIVDKLSIVYKETSFPHSEELVSQKKDSYTRDATGYQDLLGAFYLIRSVKESPKVGQVTRLKVLPSGNPKELVLKILGEKEINVPALGGKRRVLHVKSALANLKNSDTSDIFFNTKSPIEMYIDPGYDHIPVEIWTDLPYIGTVRVKLFSYKSN